MSEQIKQTDEAEKIPAVVQSIFDDFGVIYKDPRVRQRILEMYAKIQAMTDDELFMAQKNEYPHTGELLMQQEAEPGVKRLTRVTLQVEELKKRGLWGERGEIFQKKAEALSAETNLASEWSLAEAIKKLKAKAGQVGVNIHYISEKGGRSDEIKKAFEDQGMKVTVQENPNGGGERQYKITIIE